MTELLLSVNNGYGSIIHNNIRIPALGIWKRLNSENDGLLSDVKLSMEDYKTKSTEDL